MATWTRQGALPPGPKLKKWGAVAPNTKMGTPSPGLKLKNVTALARLGYWTLVCVSTSSL